MPFQKILVAIDGSPGGQKALETAIELAKLTRAELHGLAVEGKLPAYAATIGEVDEVKREKDQFFGTIARLARDQAREKGIDLQVEVLPGHAAELIVRHRPARVIHAHEERPIALARLRPGRLG